MAPKLTDDEKNRLFTELVNSRHLQDGTWRAALSGLHPGFQALLPDTGRPAPDAFVALDRIVDSGRLVDGSMPVEVVLARLKLLTPQAQLATLVSGLLASVEGRVGLGAKPGTVRYNPGQEEAYVGESDDTLDYDFLERGYIAGRSIVRVVVPRFQNNEPDVEPNGEQRKYRGTGWLIAPNLFITNFHVVCARESDEEDPGQVELALQLEHTKIELDFDRKGATVRELKPVTMVARGARGGARDYALLSVDPYANAPAPLRLRTQRPRVRPQGYPINIIQHPQGWAKRIAVRSNLLHAADAERLAYFGDTLGGSSGSPLCNDAWEVIGLHRASGPATNVMIKGQRAAAYNVGIPMSAVLADLQAVAPTIYEQIVPSILPAPANDDG